MAEVDVIYQNQTEISAYKNPEQQAGTSTNIRFATINAVQTSRQHDNTIGQPEILQTTSVKRSTANNTKVNLKRFYNVFIAVGVLAVVLAIVLCTVLVTKNEIMNLSLKLQDQLNSNKALIAAQTDLGNKTEFLLTEKENTKKFTLELEEKINRNNELILYHTDVEHCRGPLGIEDYRIKNSQMTASSQYSTYHWAYYARLNLQKGSHHAGCWAPAVSTPGTQWIQITLNERQTISGVITQGRPADYNQYVKTFNLQHSNDGTTWTYVKDNSGATKLFIGNTDRLTPVTNYLPSPVVTKYIRLIPQQFQQAQSLRMELLGC